jgi:hypothetical protein
MQSWQQHDHFIPGRISNLLVLYIPSADPQASHIESYKNLQTACANTGIMCGVLINVRGPDIHVINRQV